MRLPSPPLRAGETEGAECTAGFASSRDARVLFDLFREQCDSHAVMLLDARGSVVYWNRGASRIFGRTAAEMLGQTIHELFAPEDRAARVPEQELENARLAGIGEDNRWMLRKNGALFWASGAVQSLWRRDRTLAGYSKVLRDRTDGRGQVELLRNRIAALLEENERKLIVFGTLAHELRSPFAAIANAAQLIDMTYPGDPALIYPLQLLRRQTSYVSTLVDDLLEVVRIRTGKTVLRCESIELAQLMADAFDTVKARVDRNDQRLTLLHPPVPIRFEGDATKLKQVFVNLIENASKYSPRGGPILVTCTVEADEVVVKVEDHGRGISPELLPHIFDWLTQAPSADAEAPEGLGLGLSLVREYVDLHGGSVQVRSDGASRGSEFIVRLPTRCNEPPTPTSP